MQRIIRLLAVLTIAYCWSVTSVNAQTTLINPLTDGGFEAGATFAANNWIVVNTPPLQTNQWFCGTGAVGFTGARCAFVGTASNNNNYSNVTSVVHLYRDVVVPPGQNDIRLYFSWKCRGRSNEDYLSIYAIDPSITPTAGVPVSSGLLAGNLRNQTTWLNDSLDVPCTFSGSTVRIVFSWINDAANATTPAIAIDNIALICNGSSNCIAAMGLGLVNVPSLPYNSGPGATCGMDDDVTDGNVTVCGNPDYYSDEDVVYAFTPATSGQISIDLNAPLASSTGLMLYDGCPVAGCSGVGGSCVVYQQDVDGSKSICTGVQAGHTYYLVLDGDGVCNDYDNLFISSPNTVATGGTCANPVVLGTLPVSLINESTACMGDDYNNATAGSCGSLFESGEDKVYRYISEGNECISITLMNASSTLIGYQVYYGCPDAGGYCVATDGGYDPIVSTVTLTLPGTYFIIVDSWAPPSSVGYDLNIASFGNGPLNDDVCSALFIPNGVFTLGNNSCSSDMGEPPPPLCWSFPGIVNSVWYKAIVPASGNVTVSVQLLTLQDSQIEVFTGSCSALNSLIDGCNDNAADNCGGGSLASEVHLSGLTPGDTLFIRVDGTFDQVGTFNIMASDTLNSQAFNQQDCLGAISVCNPVINQTTSFFGCGLISDIPAPCNTSNPCVNPTSGNSGCLLSGELNIIWYSIHITAPGLLRWTHSHPMGYYDWILFDLTNNSCQDIANNTLSPVRCNWNGIPSNLCGMQNPVPGGGSPFNFEAPLSVVAGQTLVLALSNWSFTTTGYTLDFSGSSCGIGNASAISWTGTTNTSWITSTNWGGCAAPACGIDATIYPAANQPVISTNTSVNNLNILAGSSLTINPGVTLSVCGDFNNYGAIFISPNSNLLFNNGSVVQHFNGNLIGTNRVGNVIVTKSGGSLVLNDDLDIGGLLLTSNATSVFDANNHYVRLAGNFTNAAGSTTYINPGPTGTLEFNGTALQQYSSGGILDLENIVINNTGAGVNLLSGSLRTSTTGSLHLQLGKVQTNTNEVFVRNPDPASVSGGHTGSFVLGNLRRALSGAADAYDFPVGHALKGYQLANITFTTATTIPELLANFQTYATVPNGPVTTDCPAFDYSLAPVLNNGYWNFTASANPNSGTYDATLYNLNYTNTVSYATVVKSPTSPPTAATWVLDGNCEPASTAAVSIRRGMNGIAALGTGTSISPLPIELLSFTGYPEGNANRLNWVTATETNNAFFTLERSADGASWQALERQSGAGTTSERHDYQALDQHPPVALTYYRLRQTDYDGANSLSEVIAIHNRLDQRIAYGYPNPVANQLHVHRAERQEEDLIIEIDDVCGHCIRRETIHVANGETELTTQVGQLSNGTYYLRLLHNYDQQPETFVFVKNQ